MDPEKAKKLFEQGAFLIFKNAPEGMEFGIDNRLWTVGPKFLGLKMIPPGLHLVTYSLNEIDKHSFFKIFESQEVYVVEWRQDVEQISHVDDLEQIARYRSNRHNIDPFLAPYPLDPPLDYQKWQSLTTHISRGVLELVFRGGGESARTLSFSAMSSTEAEDPDREDSLSFSHFDIRRSFPPGSTGALVTKYATDKSWLLADIIASSRFSGEWGLLLGELQLSFIVLLFGSNFEGLEHWKKLSHCLMFARDAVQDPVNRQLFTSYLKVLTAQLMQIPRDFFEDYLLTDNFLTHCLKYLCGSILQSGYCSNSELGSQLEVLAKYLGKNFNWDILQEYHNEEARLDAEEGEDGPTVVSL